MLQYTVQNWIRPLVMMEVKWVWFELESTSFFFNFDCKWWIMLYVGFGCILRLCNWFTYQYHQWCMLSLGGSIFTDLCIRRVTTAHMSTSATAEGLWTNFKYFNEKAKQPYCFWFIVVFWRFFLDCESWLGY